MRTFIFIPKLDPKKMNVKIVFGCEWTSQIYQVFVQYTSRSDDDIKDDKKCIKKIKSVYAN